MKRTVIIALLFIGGMASFACAQASTNTFSLLIIGDVIFESSWRPPFRPAEKLFEHVQGEFEKADHVWINLEEPITRHPQKSPFKNLESVRRGKDFILRATNSNIPRIIRDSGIDSVTLANNHMGDYCSQGVTDTLKGLEVAGVPTVGAGRTPAEAYRPIVLSSKDITVSLLAFSDVYPSGFEAAKNRAGIAGARNEGAVRTAVEKARESSDFVIVMMHWGEHATSTVTLRQQALGRRLIDWGADAVAGMHAHFLQGIEVYDGKPIFYGLGNFAFPGSKPQSKRTAAIKLFLEKGKEVRANLMPAVISDDGQPRFVNGEDILEELDGLCREFGVSVYPLFSSR
ncbi:MAG: hypothetical protein A2901_00225 [Elusimicrobia bacterium RIFCSPLOWO2_01_FULL_54_10]|nr:MAG: hypothetical protein A2901_00225 [Elusimicrobia bacterium RIFCSPLOWO2_01_FULL_54_10]